MGTVSIDTSALRSWAGTLQSSAGQVVHAQSQVALAAADVGLLPSGASLGLQAGAAVAGLLGVDVALEGAATAIITQAMVFEAAEAELNATYQAWHQAQQVASAAWTVEEHQISAVGGAVWSVEKAQLSAVGSAVQTIGSDVKKVGGDIHTWCVDNEKTLETVASVTSGISAALGVVAMCVAPIPGLGEVVEPALEVAQVGLTAVNIAADAGLMVAGDEGAAGDMALAAAGLATDGVARGLEVVKAGGDVMKEADDVSDALADSGEAVDEAGKGMARMESLKGAAKDALDDFVNKLSPGNIKSGVEESWGKYMAELGDKSLGDVVKTYGRDFFQENLRPNEELGNLAIPHLVASTAGHVADSTNYVLDTFGQGDLPGDLVSAGFRAIGRGMSTPIPYSSHPVPNPAFQ